MIRTPERRSLSGVSRRTFICSMTYELSRDTSDAARKLLRAELVGRRWHDRVRDRRMPSNAVWAERPADDDTTASSLHDACGEQLRACVARVRATGAPIRLLRAYVQVAGGGSWGLIDPAEDPH